MNGSSICACINVFSPKLLICPTWCHSDSVFFFLFFFFGPKFTSNICMYNTNFIHRNSTHSAMLLLLLLLLLSFFGGWYTRDSVRIYMIMQGQPAAPLLVGDRLDLDPTRTVK